MILKSLELHNIRSYTSNKINFPTGNVLLSGNVGAGKSTILLAIEFALFGTRRPGLPGASLLRNGQSSAYVELEFELDNQPIIIRRTLKRSNDVVNQDTGFLTISGQSTELTPIELTQRILDMLNYPREFLTKSKSLIYRYTVYTPQEHMKEILTESNDLRLDTLRRVFGVDKYKLIKENSKILTSSIKERRKELTGFISDIFEKTNQKQKKYEQQQQFQKKLTPIDNQISEFSNQLNTKKQELSEFEKRIQSLNELRHQLQLRQSEHKTIQSRIDKTQGEQEAVNISINNLKQELEGKEQQDESSLNNQILQTKSLLTQKESSLLQIRRRIEQINTTIYLSEKAITEISSLSSCPTCKQKVAETHKTFLVESENKKSKPLLDERSSLQSQETTLTSELEQSKALLEALQKKQSNQDLIKFKFKSLNERTIQHLSLATEITQLNSELSSLTNIISELSNNLTSTSESDQSSYELIKKHMQGLEYDLKSLEIERSAIKATLVALEEDLSVLTREIEKKTEAKSKLEYLNKFLYWIDNDFTNLIDSIEKQVMAKINVEFNSLFKKWFSILMDSEDIQVSLDNEFTPIITQNSHQMDYQHLSGGEKTAAALAYRLSLNQVINNLMSEIKTNDLLILDEPTDGFSEQQLDRIRDVLEELKIGQVIIVSHETKIESFVNHIIKIYKQDHISTINI